MPIAAPWAEILSLSFKGSYVSLQGTSMATPVVAGLVGVMRSLAPSLSPARAHRLLHETGVVIPDAKQTGRMINVEAAIRRLIQR
jgi:thermitase